MNQQHEFHKKFPAFADYSRPHRNHPTDAETISDHAEARRPECFAERHTHLSAFCERRELAFGVSLVCGR
jgi:hypothetical protein